MTEHRSVHDDHDVLLIAALADGDGTGDEQAEASRLVAQCPECARLHADLRALAIATRQLPTPPRPRDFTLTPAHAARLRRRSWRGLLAAFAGPRFSLAQPLGAALTSLGVAGLLLAALPGFSLGGPTILSTVGKSIDSAYPAAAPAASPAGGDTRYEADPGTLGASAAPAEPQEQAQATAEDHRDTAGGGQTEISATAPEESAEVAQRTADSTLVIVSGSFMIVGLGLFALRWTARRLGDG